MFGNVDLYHLVVIAVFVILSSYGFHVLAFLDIVATSIWHFAWVCICMELFLFVFLSLCVCICVCVIMCVCLMLKVHVRNLLAIERTIFCFFFYIYIAFTPCLSTTLHLGIFASSCRDDLTVLWMLFLPENGCQKKYLILNDCRTNALSFSINLSNKWIPLKIFYIVQAIKSIYI